MADPVVFFDPSGRRGRRFKAVLIGGAAVVALALSGFALSLLAISFPRTQMVRPRAATAIPSELDRQKAEFLRQKARDELKKELAREKRRPIHQTETPQIVGAYYTVWQENGVSSLAAHADRLTHLFPEWLHLSPKDDILDVTDYDLEATPANRSVIQLARAANLKIEPLLNNAAEGEFRPEFAHQLLSDRQRRSELIAKLQRWLKAEGFQGVQVDFERLEPADRPSYAEFIGEMVRAFHAVGLQVSVSLEADQLDASAEQIGGAADFIVLMAYDDHDETSDAGPIAPAQFVDQVIERFCKRIDNDKIVLGVGSYAYDWSHQGVESLTYQEAIQEAIGYRDGEDPRDVIDFDAGSLNPKFSYEDDKGQPHEVWFLDATTVHNSLKLGEDAHLRGSALWVLGSEDPSMWSIFGRQIPLGKGNPKLLETIRYPYEVEFVGQGEILSVKSEPHEGRRKVEVDPDSGLVTDNHTITYATPLVFGRQGKTPKTVVLTFDDGPDPTWTPAVLDILAKYQVKATFFVVGQSAERYPDLVRREFEDGHEIGSHTYTHPNMGYVSDTRARLEMNATQRAIQAVTGRSTTLFRPPFNADSEPTTLNEVRPFRLASDLGYVCVGEQIDPLDWSLYVPDSDPPRRRTGAQIADDVLRQLAQKRASVVLLHDAGGDRSQTIAALQILLPTLVQKGYRFGTVADLMHSDRDHLMPVLKPQDLALVGLDNLVFTVYYQTERLLAGAFIFAIVLGIARAGVLACLALIAHRRSVASPVQIQPTVAVVVAAYNEEETISRTVQSILNDGYRPLTVWVIDDGSSDGTSQAVDRAFRDEPNVRIIRQANGGKASALNHALELVDAEVMVCIDADTVLAAGSIQHLVNHFADNKVGAVAGNVRVGNRDENLLTRWQDVEYTTSQNLDRRAFGLLNGITVVPGAIGAWRTAAVRQVGGYMTDTLAEDMDLTWRIRMADYRIVNEPLAKAYTEAPDNLPALFKQRYRWAFGSLQCLWKHRSALGRFGWFGKLVLPMQWILQVIFQPLAPIVDLRLLVTAVGAIWATIQVDSGHASREIAGLAAAKEQIQIFAFLYGIFFLVELIAGLISYRLEGERPTSLIWLFLQRFVYRQIMVVVMIKALLSAILGRRLGWGKLERRGTVKVPG
jgi:poly-beta-1,6 N-acetyl-D-glucosamine synthase